MSRLSGALLGSLLTTGLVVLLSTAHCGPTCDRDPGDPPVVYNGGRTVGDVYESSDVSGPLLDFPPGRTYRLMHDLGARPRDVDAYLAFDPFPLEGPNNETGTSSNIAWSAGNQTVIEAKTAEYIDVRNDTCADGAFLYVVASEPESTPADGDGGAADTTADVDAALASEDARQGR